MTNKNALKVLTAEYQSDTRVPKEARIARVRAVPLSLPAEINIVGVRKTVNLSVCLCEIETETGLCGTGFTAITEEEAVAAIINEIAAPMLIGQDVRRIEQLWEKLYWLLSPRGQTGYASHAIAALDIALWDIKGKMLNEPVWRLLGGARERVPLYTTFGFGFLERDALAQAAKHWVSLGHRRLKMTVGGEALQRRDDPRPIDMLIAEDALRVRAVREAVGPDVGIYIDANCSLDAMSALKLARMVEDLNIGFFEEPITQNDVGQLVQLKGRTHIPLACGQNEGLAFRFRDLLLRDAVDVLQPNVAITGGYSQCMKIAGMASAFNVAIANGGAWPFHNMHLHAGVSNGGLVEYHIPAVMICSLIYKNLPLPENGWLTLPTGPGLGFDPDWDAVRELSKRPTARGYGKG